MLKFKPPPGIHIYLGNFPQTTTILAIGFLVGCLVYTPMIALIGKYVPAEYQASVETIVGLFKDGMLLILGYYFAKTVNQGQQEMANKAIDAATTAASTQKVDSGG